ncbi:MAG: FprA family A-type flavoprotein [Bacteroidales bacterium]|nr:FprA family A-type flavoprotein [Bacteroidales bacterium]
MIKKINEAVAYIGTDDLELDLFESQYEVPEGMAYNSYLIQDEKVAIMDTVDARCAQAWKENLAEALGDRTPDYLVVHHLEPDHTGLIDWVTRRYPALQVVASAKALQMMGQFFDGLDLTGRSLAVKEGDTLSLGGRSLTFYGAPMVHWPEVMVSWLDADRILFSADAFGKFGALSKCGYFSEEDGDWACEARRYYFNICGKYGLQVQALLKKVLPLPLDTICPLHGPVLRGDLAPYTGLYDTWSRYGVETEGVFVAYASIHGGTAAAALKMADILRAKGCPKVAVADLSRDDQAEAVEDAFRYGKVILAASSYDAGVFPPMDIFLHHLRDKAWQKRRVGLIENGSWAPSAGRVMREQLSAMKEIELVEPLVTLRSRMKDSDLAALEALADAILA